MKGLNVKKLAAIAVGGALVGSALAPLAAAIDVSKSDVIGADGAPVVSVVAGSNAQVSDVIWAGNIAAKIAQLATVDTALQGGEGSATPTGLSVDLAVGGETSYSTEYSKTYDGTSYPLNATVNTADEFLKNAGHGQLPFLTNETQSYRYNGATYNIAVKENIGIAVDVDFDDSAAIKDLVAYMDQPGDFNYVLDLGEGIPAWADSTAAAKFTDGDNDNVVIPFLGEEYTVQEADGISATKQLKLIKESAKTNYNEGDTIPGLTGKADYAGEEMSIKIAAVTQTSSTATYQARFELYDGEGNLVDSQTVASGVYLNESFLDTEGAYALETVVYVSTVNVEPTTSKGVITMIVGKNVVTIADGKQYPYDSTDTSTSNDYWKANMDFNTAINTSPAVMTLEKITIYNSVQKWNNTEPLYSSDDSLTQAGKDAADAGGDTAHFLQGEETGLGYDFVKVKFDGFKYDQDKGIVKIGNNALVYTDSGGENRSIPFYIRVGTPSSEPDEVDVVIDDSIFHAKCYKNGNSTFTVDVYDGNYLNGSLVEFTSASGSSDLLISTDNDDVNIMDANSSSVNVDINGVQYVVTDGIVSAAGKLGATLTADGNCSYTVTQDGTDYVNPAAATSSNTLGVTSQVVNTVYFDDDNTSRGPGDTPIHFAEDGVITDTYRYRQYYSDVASAVYLLLDGSTDFSTNVTNIDVNFIGTDISESTRVPLANINSNISEAFPAYYWPDHEYFGNDAGDTAYLIAHFGLQADSTTTGDDFLVYVDTATDDLVQYPNTDLSNYTADVNCIAASNPSWALKARTDIESALYSGYLEYGTKAELTDDMTTATITTPEAQVYLSLSVLGEGATQTVEGGETVESVGESETVTIAGKDITVSAINYTEGTCTVEGSTYPKVVSVGQLVYSDSPAPAGNHVIVGGYIVNKLAEEVVLGDGSTLQEALTASGDKVAELLAGGDIVVAGYTAADTKAAAQELIAALDALME